MLKIGLLIAWLPPAVRLPVVAGLIVFVVGAGTTQVALFLQSLANDTQLEQIGEVYLDGLVASARPAIEAEDGSAVARLFEKAFQERQGISERGLFAFATDGRLLARHGDESIPLDRAAQVSPGTLTIDHDIGLGWVGRTVDAGRGGKIVAALEFEGIVASRRRLAWGVILVDIVLAAAAGIVAYLALSRMGRPITTLLDRLRRATVGPPTTIPSNILAEADHSIAPLIAAYNAMAESARERQRLLGEAAERDQAAALGRLAAIVAHEVRNPLAGLATAVSTLDRFGDDPEVRREAIGLLGRGIDAIDRMVTSTLNFYRPTDERRLSRDDFDDLEHLVKPAAERAGVRLDWCIDLPTQLAVGATGVRQVLLNLLLNACAAAAPGGTVTLTAGVEDGMLICTIADDGEGLESGTLDHLDGAADRAGAPSRRLGIGVVVELLGSLDGRAVATSEPGRGTTVRIAIPIGSDG